MGARGGLKRLLLVLTVVAACRSTPPTSPPAAWHDEAGYRWRELALAGTLTPGFTQLTHTGIAFTNLVNDSELVHNRQLAQGAGVCLADVDGDGRPDVFLASTDGPNALYHNLGDWHFADSTASAGLAAPGRHATGCVFGDIDGVCVVPRAAEKEAFAKALEKARGEKLVKQAIASGMSAVAAFEQYGIM